MKVRLHGFALDAGCDRISITDLLDQLEAESGPILKFGGQERILLVKNEGQYALGLFVSFKDFKKFCSARRTVGKGVRLKAQDLDPDESLVDFNYFVIHRKTGRGIYQHYHQACRFSRFGAFLSERYRDLLTRRRDVAIKEAGPGAPKKTEREIRKNYKGILDYSVIVRPEKVDDLLDEMLLYRQFQYDMTTFTNQERGTFRSVGPFVKKKRVLLTFDPKLQNPKKVKEGMLDIIDANGVEKGWIKGRDSSNRRVTVRLDENVDVLSEHEYDQVAEEIDVDVLDHDDKPIWDFVKSPMIKRIVQVIGQHPGLFEKPEKK